MTTLNEARLAVATRFLAQYTGVASGRIVLQNEDEDFSEDTTIPWIRLSVLDQVRTQQTLGKVTNRRYLSLAQVFVQIFTETGIGMNTGDNLATEALGIFEGVSFSGLDFNDGLARQAGADGKWYQHIVEVNFDYDEIK